jgi:RND family efflux transporter MFP subunit
MKNMQKINRIILVLVIIGLALFVTMKLAAHKARPQRLIHETSGAVVNVVTAKRSRLNLEVVGTGLVKPLQEVSISPQVSGQVVYTSPRLVQSGFFKKGDVLFKIEDTDSRLVVEQAKADMVKTELELAQIQGQADIALQEWKLLNKDGAEPYPLVVYKPQLASAKAMMSSARAKVKRAELDVERTTVTAPFNCFIRSKNVEIGQYVRVGNVVLNLVGTDQAEIMVPLALTDVAVVVIPEKHSGETSKLAGSPVTVRLNIGQECHVWNGYIDRLAGALDPASRMLDVIIVVNDPYMLKEKTVHSMPLVMGSFVNVEIEGREYDDVVKIPRAALRDGSTVWIATADSTLQVRKVSVLRRNQDNVVIHGGLEGGEKVILTPLRGASPGMKLRVQQETYQVEGKQ